MAGYLKIGAVRPRADVSEAARILAAAARAKESAQRWQHIAELRQALNGGAA